MAFGKRFNKVMCPVLTLALAQHKTSHGNGLDIIKTEVT